MQHIFLSVSLLLLLDACTEVKLVEQKRFGIELCKRHCARYNRCYGVRYNITSITCTMLNDRNTDGEDVHFSRRNILESFRPQADCAASQYYKTRLCIVNNKGHKVDVAETTKSLEETVQKTVQHLVSGCPSLAQTAYLKRHDGMTCCFYYRLRHACGFDTEVRPWYDPEHVHGVMENDAFKLLWNRPIYSLRRIPANKPDVVLFDKANEFIYVLSSGDVLHEAVASNMSSLENLVCVKDKHMTTVCHIPHGHYSKTDVFGGVINKAFLPGRRYMNQILFLLAPDDEDVKIITVSVRDAANFDLRGKACNITYLFNKNREAMVHYYGRNRVIKTKLPFLAGKLLIMFDRASSGSFLHDMDYSGNVRGSIQLPNQNEAMFIGVNLYLPYNATFCAPMANANMMFEESLRKWYTVQYNGTYI